MDLAVIQIECRQKFGKKLADTLSAHPHWLFTSVLSGEQSTSDMLASFHASLIPEGAFVADLTAGLGIDCLHLSAKTKELTAIEIDRIKADALRQNLHYPNVNVVCDDCRNFITNYHGAKFDVVFIDPARRGADGSRIFSLSDCHPDVTEMLPRLRKIADTLIVKMSPMLDITHTAKSLPGVSKIIALGTRTECKELIAVVDLNSTSVDECSIEAIILDKANQTSLLFTPEEERQAASTFAMPQEGGYIYEPYAAVMKAAPFNLLCRRYGAVKLSANTNLYTSTEPATDFPGHTYKILETLPYSSSVIKRLAKKYPKGSIATRNFSVPAEVLRKKLKIADGTDTRIYGASCADGKEYLIVCKML